MYVVIELQKNGDTVANLVTQHNTIAEAKHKYYAVLSAAAISSVGVHSATILDDHGVQIASGAFDHERGD